MPQFNIPDFPPQLIWLAISFALLYLIMSRVALPEVAKVLDDRKQRIADDLGEAGRLRDATQAAIASYEQALAAARTRAQSIARASRETMTAEMDKQRAELDAQIGGRMADAEKRISEMKDEAARHISEIATDAAEALVARFTGKPGPRPELASTVNEVLGK